MAYPYAERTRVLTEVGDPLETFVRRLEMLGAPSDVVASVRAHWNEGDTAERDAFVAKSDDEIRRELRRVEDEWHLHTHTEDEQALAELDAVLAHLGDAQVKVTESIPIVKEWIGDDRARAVAAWVAEQDTAGPNRKGVIELVESMAGDWIDRLAPLLTGP